MNGDVLDEGDDTFAVNLSNAVGAIGRRRAGHRHDHRRRRDSVALDQRRHRHRGQHGHGQRHVHGRPERRERPHGDGRLRDCERHGDVPGRLPGAQRHAHLRAGPDHAAADRAPSTATCSTRPTRRTSSTSRARTTRRSPTTRASARSSTTTPRRRSRSTTSPSPRATRARSTRTSPSRSRRRAARRSASATRPPTAPRPPARLHGHRRQPRLQPRASRPAQFTVQTIGDTLDEVDETFAVNLADPVNATIADGQGLGTITDDDAPPTISVGDVTVTEGNSGTVAATFTVSLNVPSGRGVTVDYATANGTATAPADYQAASGHPELRGRPDDAHGHRARQRRPARRGERDLLRRSLERRRTRRSPTHRRRHDHRRRRTARRCCVNDVTVTEGDTGTVDRDVHRQPQRAERPQRDRRRAPARTAPRSPRPTTRRCR